MTPSPNTTQPRLVEWAMTLVEQLEDGAAALGVLALQEERAGLSAVVAASRRARAEAMFARAKVVREVEAQHTDTVGKAYDEGWQDALEAVTGPLREPGSGEGL